LRNKEALQHGMMASFYCQELIRNSHILCQGYISKLQEDRSQQRASKPTDPNTQTSEVRDEEIFLSGKQPTYYVEENEKFLNLLISNCEPILNEIVSKFDNFNNNNKMETAFEHQVNNSYSDEDDESILKVIAEEFSIKNDIAIPKKAGLVPNKMTTNNSKPGAKNKPAVTKESGAFQSFSYKNLRNNYLYKPKGNEDDSTRRSGLRDEATPEQFMERKKSLSELSAYYNTQGQAGGEGAA